MTPETPEVVAVRARRRVHRAWAVAAVTFLALVAAAAFRSSIGVILEPLEREFGWSRAATSAAISLNLLLYGLVAPFAAALMERLGIRRVVAAALAMVALGSGLTLAMRSVWQLVVLWGLVVGPATGAMALVFGAVVANRWFMVRRGLVTGVFGAASASGQLVFLPVIARVATDAGWRWAVAATAALALAMVPLVLVLLRDRPADVGLLPYGAGPGTVVPPPAPVVGGAARRAVDELRRSSRSGTFWVLMATFFVCGWSTNGLIQTHFVPAAHDHGMPVGTAAGLLAVVGLFDIVGTVGSGWLTDRTDPRLLLVVYYGLRGLSLMALPSLLGPDVTPSVLVVIVFYGLDWVATVPPTVALCRAHFGLERSGVVFGWVFASHMVGAGVAAQFAGVVRESTGSYAGAMVTAGALCLVAAFGSLTVPAGPQRRTATTQAAVAET